VPTIEERLASIEEEVALLKATKNGVDTNEQPWYERIRGTFKDDPDYDEAMRLGRQWRESFRPKDDDATEI
jgi:hypothetical protein